MTVSTTKCFKYERTERGGNRQSIHRFCSSTWFAYNAWEQAARRAWNSMFYESVSHVLLIASLNLLIAGRQHVNERKDFDSDRADLRLSNSVLLSVSRYCMSCLRFMQSSRGAITLSLILLTFIFWKCRCPQKLLVLCPRARNVRLRSQSTRTECGVRREAGADSKRRLK